MKPQRPQGVWLGQDEVERLVQLMQDTAKAITDMRDDLRQIRQAVGANAAAPANAQHIHPEAILTKKQLGQFVAYSVQHVARLEAAGKFPKRVRLGEMRVGWRAADVFAWLESRRNGSATEPASNA